MLTFYGPDIKSTLVINPEHISHNSKANILKTYKALQKRKVKNISEEMKQEDRKALDAAVLEALGLDPERYLPRIYQGLVEMVNERLTLPKLRLARQKKEQRASSEQVKAQVQQERLPNGLKPIGAFLSHRV